MIYSRIAKLENWKRKLILIFVDLNSFIFAVWLSFWLRLSDYLVIFSKFLMDNSSNLLFGNSSIYIFWILQRFT